ncbi:MAG: hypothetical protein KGN02_05690 [bacterium]|nr:hypothetical protein [bacterium]
MLVDPNVDRALERIAERERDVQHAYTPGAFAVRDDAAARPSVRAELDPLAAAAPDGAFFVTTDDRGRTAYTRDGACTLRDGMLVGVAGSPMLGFVSAHGGTRELRVDPVDLALGRIEHPRIEANGAFAYDRLVVDPRTGTTERERVEVGRLALARFPAGTAFAAASDARVAAPDGVLPHVGRARDGTFGALAPMHRATSGIAIDRGLDRLHDAYLAFDAMIAARTARDGASKTTLGLVK